LKDGQSRDVHTIGRWKKTDLCIIP
jgi:hypothetical protein